MANQETEIERIPVRREDFAPGEIGQRDFEWIVSGMACESIKEKDNEKCGVLSREVVDFDISSGTEGIPVCGKTCEQRTMQRIIRDEAARGKDPAIGVNGWGRH